MPSQLFDSLADKYNRWFHTPIGALIHSYEQQLMLEFLQPAPGECILDAGCGTGIFTESVLARGADVIGMDLSLPMLEHAHQALPRPHFTALAADMRALPFADGVFDKTVSITALEFIAEAQQAVEELFRVTRPGGRIVIATLNSLSPWAERRDLEALNNEHSVFRHTYFRSPDELQVLAQAAGTSRGLVRTAIHFAKNAVADNAREDELAGQKAALETGAFVIGCWHKG